MRKNPQIFCGFNQKLKGFGVYAGGLDVREGADEIARRACAVREAIYPACEPR